MTKPDTLIEKQPTGFEGLPLKDFLTYRLSRVQAKLNAQMAKILRENVGLTVMQWRVIALVGAAGQTRFSALVKEAVLDKGFLSRNLKTLIEQGFILSEPDENDQRAQNLRLSSKGQSVFEQALPITRRRQEWLGKDLSPDEIATFRRVLEKLELASEKQDF
jgi:DNA-binding MarR family transcriptional regulator